ncbi:UNVERIFIED_ORG: hypothetical protein M2328_006498 [Rhodococcus erythropolis]
MHVKAVSANGLVPEVLPTTIARRAAVEDRRKWQQLVRPLTTSSALTVHSLVHVFHRTRMLGEFGACGSHHRASAAFSALDRRRIRTLIRRAVAGFGFGKALPIRPGADQ